MRTHTIEKLFLLAMAMGLVMFGTILVTNVYGQDNFPYMTGEINYNKHKKENTQASSYTTISINQLDAMAEWMETDIQEGVIPINYGEIYINNYRIIQDNLWTVFFSMQKERKILQKKISKLESKLAKLNKETSKIN